MNLSTGLLWRLDELVRRSQQSLALLPAGESRRVRWQPDARLVRYYTTLGLLDRPAELRGRTAYYRDRHLLQLLAIKALQARGLSLQAVQTQLAGQPDAALAALIGLPPDWAARLPAGEVERADNQPLATASGVVESATTAPARFWERAPGPTPPPEPPTSTPSSPPTAGLTESVTELLAVTLAPGARLLLDRNRYPELDDRLEAALQNLSAALHAVARSSQDSSDRGEQW
ncbi:MAG TPA: MerR family transcriptional regulator [Candidatus Competibacter sp.]|nr:MerR family transcriptional regulator [Candidatus Competibacter sp.]